MKSEPESRFENGIDMKVLNVAACAGVSLWTHGVWFAFQFGIEDLKAMSDQTSCWDGVRNYQVGPSNLKHSKVAR